MALSGQWLNELGSRMHLEASADGTLRGTYHTQVGNAEGIYRLVGSFDPDGAAGSPASYSMR